MQTTEQLQHVVANAKLAGVSGATFGVGAWTWLGDNQSELGALASCIGIIGVLISIFRGSRK